MPKRCSPTKLMDSIDIFNKQKTQLFYEFVIIACRPGRRLVGPAGLFARRPACRQLTKNKNYELINESSYFFIAINWQAEFTISTFSLYGKRIRRSPSTGLQRQQQQQH